MAEITLDDNIAAYEANEGLLELLHWGKFVVYNDKQIVSVDGKRAFNDDQEAAAAAIPFLREGKTPLVRRVGEKFYSPDTIRHSAFLPERPTVEACLRKQISALRRPALALQP